MSIIEVYYRLVKAGRRTIESIPEQHRSDVQALVDNEQGAPSP